MSDYKMFNDIVRHMTTNLAPGQPVFKSDSLRQRVLHAFAQSPQWMCKCNTCRSILNRTAGLLTCSTQPNGLVQSIYEGASTLPFAMGDIIASYYMEDTRLLPILFLPPEHVHLCDDVIDPSMREFFLLMSPDKKTLETLTDVKSVDPRTVALKTYDDDNKFSHFPMPKQMVRDLDTTKELWILAGTVQSQAVKLAGVFGVSDLKYEMGMLEHAVRLFFAKNPTDQAKYMRALGFIPQLAENSESRQNIVCTLNLMGFQVTPSTYSASSILYTLATILVTTPVDESITSSANDVPPLQRLIVRLQNDAPNLSFHEARRVALGVWQLWMRNRSESSYMTWMCPTCACHNSNSDLDPDDTMLYPKCSKCKATQPTANGWSCRDCKVRNYDSYNNSGVLITPLACLDCNTPRGMALGVWACPICTFHNKVHVLNCEMCRTAKPIG